MNKQRENIVAAVFKGVDDIWTQRKSGNKRPIKPLIVMIVDECSCYLPVN